MTIAHAPFSPHLRFMLERPFRVGEVLAAGLTRDEFRAVLRRGLVREILYGVYGPADWPVDQAARALAAAAVMPPGSVAVDRTAASLHGVDVFDFAELVEEPRLEFAALGGRNASRRPEIFGCKRDLLTSEVTTIGGVAVTTAARTACDIACLRGRHRAIGTLDAFRSKLGVSEAELTAQLPRFEGRRGVTQLRSLIPLSSSGVDSPPESWIRIELHDAGFPMPAAQAEVIVPGWGRARIENAYVHLKIGVEYDSDEHHSTEEEREHDRARRAALAGIDWKIVVVRRDGFSGPGLSSWLGEVRRGFDLRGPLVLDRRRYAVDPTNKGRHRRTRW